MFVHLGKFLLVRDNNNYNPPYICPKCGSLISSVRKVCPKCGYTVK